MRNLLLPINDYAILGFSTRNPTTKIVQDADSTPTVEVYEDDLTAPMAGVTKSVSSLAATGQYNALLFMYASDGFEVGRTYTVRVNATVNGVVDEDVVGTVQITEQRVGTIPPTVDEIWGKVLWGRAVSQLLVYAAVGAGVGLVDTGEAWDITDNREELTYMPDGATPGFTVISDKYGNRQSVTFHN